MKEIPHQSIMSEWHAQYVQDVQCPGDCNLGRPCQVCGSNGQYVGQVGVYRTCGECIYFGPIGCTTSKYEQKFGNASTPACDEFKRKV